MRAEKDASRTIFLVVPGSLDTLTGGYLYDRRILAELRRLGNSVEVVSLDESFPMPTHAALDDAESRFAAIPDESPVVIDGLALAGLGELLPGLVERLDVIALIHHPLADETGLEPDVAASLAAAETAALAAVRGIVVTSPWTRGRLADFGVEPSRVAVVEPGTDAVLVPDTASVLVSDPAPVTVSDTGAGVRLLTVATVTPRKGHATLVAALATLGDLDWTLRCVGSLERDRACAAALKKQIERAGLAGRIELAGEVAPDRIADEYVRADLFVLPSWLEGYGMAIVEAVAHGLPVVSTTGGAIPDTAPAGAARLVPPGDAAALAEVLRALIADRTELDALARGARAAAAQLPSWEMAGRRFIEAIEGEADR